MSRTRNRDEAHRRLDHAGHELAKLGPLPQLRRRGRHDKATLLNRFEDDVRDAERKVSRCEQNLGDSRTEFVEEIAWEVQYGCRTERLNSASSKPNSPNFGEKTSLPRSNTPPAAAPTLFLIAVAAPSCQPWIGTNDSPKSRFLRYLAGTRDTDSISASEHSRTGCQELRLQG